MTKIVNDINELIGNTLLVKLNKLTKDVEAKTVGKLEFFNPCGSVKDRIGVSMITEAEKLNFSNNAIISI
jgi:cysteine synthase A